MPSALRSRKSAERFIRASSAIAFELHRVSWDNLSRGADVAPSQPIDGREPEEYERRRFPGMWSRDRDAAWQQLRAVRTRSVSGRTI
jgi:hypothetical protein